MYTGHYNILSMYVCMYGLVTCELTAYTQESALGPTFGNEHGRTLPLAYTLSTRLSRDS